VTAPPRSDRPLPLACSLELLPRLPEVDGGLLNPAGLVPLLLIDGRPLTEVAGILFYLARRFPEARLLRVGDPEAEAHVVSWMSFVASTLHPTMGAFNRATDDAARSAATRRTRAVFELADGPPRRASHVRARSGQSATS